MKNNNEKKNSILKKVAVFFGAIAASIGIIAVTYNGSDLYFSKARDKYSSDQAYIKSADFDENDNYISMSDANDLDTVAEGKIITISTVDELNKFSTKCNSTDAFLGYSYELISNINYREDEQALTYFEPIGWKKNKPFTGTFNGNGYEIEELTMAFNSSTGYDDMKFYSMFSVNNGTITNLGLSHPSVTTTAYLDAFGDDGGVSYLCGQNNGTISNSFVVDDRNAIEKKSGITASGGCRIADLCIENNGTLSNNYVVTSAVVNVQTQDYIEFAEIALTSTTSTATNYYLNTSIESYLSGVIKYKEEFNWPNKSSNHGTYISNKTTLLDTLEENDWYIADTYGDLSLYVGITYGIMRGIEQDENNDKILYIDDEKDYAYMYELFSHDDYMASNAITYIIRDDIDLSLIPAFSYSYAKGIGATIKGTKGNSGIPVLANGNNSDLFTLYNADILGSGRVSKNAGVNCFGLFNFVTGTIKDLNIVPKDIDLKDLQIATGSANVNGIGVVSGYVEGGTIDNVHVYANISNSTTSKDLGEYYLGGITGILGGSGKIFDSTTSGEINLVAAESTIPAESKSYMRAIAIGGAVGYIEASLGTLYTVTNTMNITAKLGTATIDYSVGGVIGAGYTTNSKYTIVSGNNSLETQVMTSNLSNIGEIKVGVQDNSKYNTLYVSGVIAKHMGVTNQVSSFDNSGKITVYTNGKKTYVSGVENADIVTEAVNNTGITASQFKTAEGNRLFYASAFSNGEEVKVVGSDTNLNYTNVLNINATNGYKSKVDGLYNLAYNEKYVSNSIKKSKLDAQEITITNLGKFAPVLNVVGGSSSASTEASKLYNLRSINFSNTAATTKTLNYAGVALGEYISYDDVRNEGDLTFTLNATVTGNLTVSGLFNEISSGAKANNLYNAGNITINYTAVITGNIYASGICYQNKNGYTDAEIALFDPSNNNYDKTLVGSLNNAINNGEITVTNPSYSSLEFTNYHDIKSANGSVTTERHFYVKTAPSVNLKGTICASGITVINESVITNTFNIGDVFTANYINDTKRNEVNSSGLVTYNIGKYAIIENCANDGDIKAINLSFYMVFNNGQSNVNVTTAQNAFVTSSGIVCHNDEYLNGSLPTVGSTGNSKQIIAFTINYGSIYSYNYYRNSTSSAASDFRTISSGIVGQGLLNIVNVMNYGNIYGSEVASGIFGVVFFNTFESEVDEDNKVILANTINYSPVKVIDKGVLNYRDSNYINQTYSTFVALDSNSTNYYYEIPVYSKDYYNASIFGIINFAGNTKAEYVDIRYLISFNENLKLVGAEAQTPSITVDVTKFYSAYLTFESGYVIDTYVGNTVTYAPISSGSETINHQIYYGVFNSNFPFYQAIKGNSEYLDIEHHRTDVFISDYFEFIGATYVNPLLLNKIGWGEIAYTAAADAFATDLEGVAKFITYIKNLDNKNHYNDLITSALNTDTWLSKCDDTVLLKLTDTLIENEDTATLLEMLDYIFSSSSTSYSLIKTDTRRAILEAILASDLSLDYTSLLDTIITYANGYSSVLANGVLDSSDEAGNYLKSYIASLSNSEIETILTTFCEYLENSSTNAYFTYKNSEQIRFDILSAIFKGLDDNTFYEKLATLLGIKDIIDAATINEKTAMYESYSALTDAQKINLYKAIIVNNTTSTNAQRLETYINQMSSEIDYYLNIINNGYSKTSLDNIYSDTSVTTSSTSESVIDERVALWNQIRNTDIFKSYLQSLIGDEYVAKATEFRNTYQTTTKPLGTAYSSAGDLSYTYTFNITPSTYFLGPYTDTSKNQFYYVPYDGSYAPTCGDSNQTARSVIDVTTKAEADYLLNSGYTKNYQLFYYEYSDSSSNNQLCAVRRFINGSVENKYAFTWYKTSKSTDFTGGFLRGTYTDTNDSWVEGETWVDEPIWVTDTTSLTFDANGGGISRFTSDTGGTTGEGGYADNLARTGSWIITDANGKQHTVRGTLTDWADFIIAHEIRHYISYPTDKLHSTLCTGLGKYRSGNRWFVWNSSPVYTSEYIDYSIDDLCKLDGYLTSYDDGTTKDDTEREIINTIFNTYFVSNNQAFKRIVAAALLERNSYVDNDSYYLVSTPTLNQNFTLYYTLTATAATSYDASKKYYKLESGNYIEVDSSLVNSSNYGNYYFVTATRAQTYDSSETYYEMKDIDYYNYDYLDGFFVTNIYLNTIVDEGKTPFNYLYQSYSSTTVKQFLSSNVTSDFKDKFIAYCASNQSAYAKLLLELIKLNGLSVSSEITFPLSIGNSSVDNISINNIASYDTLNVVNTVRNFEDEDYNYGYTFKTIEISGLTNYQNLYLYMYSTTSVNITYTIDGVDSDTYNVNGSTIVHIEIENNSTVQISVPNANVGSVALYYAYADYELEPESFSGSTTYYHLNEPDNEGSTKYKPGYLIYQLPTANDINTKIYNTLVANGITPVEYGYTTIAMTVISYHFNTNGNARYHRIVLDGDGSTSTADDVTILGTSTNQLNTAYATYTCDYVLNATNLGQYVGLMTSSYRNTGYAYSTTTKSGGYYRFQLKSIYVSITYWYTLSNFEYHTLNLVTTESIYSSLLHKMEFSDEEIVANQLLSSNNYSTKYNNLIIDATHNLIPIDYSQIGYRNTLVSGTYYLRSGEEGSYTYSLATGSYNSSSTYYTRSGSGTNEDPYVYTVASSITSNTYYASCTSNAYYLRSGTEGNYVYNLATGDYSTSTNYYHLEGEEYVLYGNASKNIKGILGLSYYHDASEPSEYCVPELIEKLITSSNEAFISFVDSVVSQSSANVDDYEIIIRYLIENIGYYSLGDAVKSKGTSLTTNTKDALAAAYLVSDYKYILKNSTSVYDSFLADKIRNSMASSLQYIKSDGTYDIDKFYAFCDEIGYDLSTAGYGIYALASNQGKLNGQFIPDNLNIISMDDNYSPETIEETSIITLNNLNTSYWRGGNDVIEGNVNYAFYKDMKQVEKSISTAILEISIEYDGEIIYGDVDIDDEVITFYVSDIIVGNYDIKSLVLAYEAKTNKNVGSKISVTSTSNNVTHDSITITAEEEAIVTTYDIKFVKSTTVFELKYSDNSESKSFDLTKDENTFELSVTSKTGKLPEGLNLEHFITFVGDDTYDISSEHIALSVLSTDHRVDSDGNATITVIVSNSLPADTYEITLSISGISDHVTLVKAPNTGKEITEFGFDGELRTFDENYELESTIPFGRAYNYEELKDNTSENFYLYAFKYSSNANLVIDVSKSIDDSGLMTYLVQYSLTAEAGGQPRVYKHYIKENQFFDQDSDYASVFADGETVKGRPDDYDTLSAEERVKYLNDGTFTYDLSKDICIKDANDNCTWDLTDDMKLKVAFNRGYDPQYRIKYNLANFYTLGANVVFGPTAATLALEATVNNTYAGLTITVSQNNDVGTYTFVYTYTNTGVWENNVEYTRYYEFPELVIEKIASTDALLWSLTFLEEAIALGNTATVVYPTRVVVPDKSDTTVGYNDTDIIYDTAFTSTTRDIVVSSTGIRYKNGTSATTIKDYFAVGTVSNADLQYYCPGFEINEYAEMYQYTTLAKLTGYGSDNNQETKDLQLLTNHDTTYLYIPFNKDGEITNYLVELDSNGYWTNVYMDTFDGTNASTTLVHTYTSNTVNTHNAKREGSITGIGRVDASAGLSTSNQSLYMNYVGNPVKGHFWYVSYVIFSEDYLTGGRSEGNIRYYHISIIDTTNTIQFNVTVYAENSFTLPDIYLTISENIYKLKSNNEKEYVSSSQISAYAIDTETTYSGSRTDIAGYKIYTLRFNLQTLPAGYFYFYVDLPDGYEAVAHTDMVNQLILYNTNGTIKSKDQMADVEVGSFLPFTSIITQYVDLEIVINRGTGENSGAWAINTTDIYTRQAEYEVLNP